jgi:hypothetical protein
MAFIPGGFNDEDGKEHLSAAMATQKLSYVEQIEVPARTLSEILDDISSPNIDLFSLDV